MKSHWLKGALAATAMLVVATGCSSSKASGSSENAAVPGVTDKDITLGIMVPLTGPFGAFTKPVVAGLQLFWDQKNADGGVCGRQVKLLIEDNQYNSQIVVTQYQDIKNQILLIGAAPGTPIASALSPLVKQDKILTMVPSQASALLGNPYIVETMTMYEQEVLNGLSYLVKEKGLAKGDTVGLVGFVGDYGNAVLRGLQFGADQLGLKVVTQRVNPTDSDMSAQVSAFKAAGAKAVFMATAGGQTASLASVAQSTNYDVTIMAMYPAFDVGSLKTTAKDAIVSSVLVASSVAPFDADTPAVTKVREAFLKKYPDIQPAFTVNAGYSDSAVTAAIMEKACVDGKITRQSVEDAVAKIGTFDSGGIVVPLNYDQRDKSPGMASFILKVDPSVSGGLVSTGDPVASDLAKSYK